MRQKDELCSAYNNILYYSIRDEMIQRYYYICINTMTSLY